MASAGAMGFVGVSTGQSSIRNVFPEWARALGLESTELVGFDLPMGAAPEEYRAVITRLRDDPAIAGSLITTHKVNVYETCRDMFDAVDTFAELCGEISSVSKHDGKLIGHAKDPITAGLSLEEFLTPDYFERTGGEVLVLGAGGAGTAIAWYLAQRPDAPARITCTARRQDRLDHLLEVFQRAGIDSSCLNLVRDEGPADRLVAQLPAHSVVINATGMGKDIPGSPLTDDAKWPEAAIAWELNYRGSLEFLHQAEAAKAVSGVEVVDGWRYFIHGWSQVVAEVFDVELTPETVNQLSNLAERVRK